MPKPSVLALWDTLPAVCAGIWTPGSMTLQQVPITAGPSLQSPKPFYDSFKKVALIAGQAWSRWKMRKCPAGCIWRQRRHSVRPLWDANDSRSLSSDQYLYSYTLASELQWMHLTKRIMQTQIRGYTNPRKLCSNLHILLTCQATQWAVAQPLHSSVPAYSGPKPRPALLPPNQFGVLHGISQWEIWTWCALHKTNRNCIGNTTSNASDRL